MVYHSNKTSEYFLRAREIGALLLIVSKRLLIFYKFGLLRLRDGSELHFYYQFSWPWPSFKVTIVQVTNFVLIFSQNSQLIWIKLKCCWTVTCWSLCQFHSAQLVLKSGNLTFMILFLKFDIEWNTHLWVALTGTWIRQSVLWDLPPG